MSASWAKTGAAAHTAMAESEAARAAERERNQRMWRFWLETGSEAPITFVDGDLLPDGSLNFFAYHEHTLLLNGTWNNHFVCVREMEPCPICESGDRAAFVGVFTVIDHRQYKTKKGEVYSDVPRLLVAKADTLKLLSTIAAKRGGLAGARFDVMRIGDKAPSVGSQFDFMEKTPIEELRKKYVKNVLRERYRYTMSYNIEPLRDLYKQLRG